MEIAQQNRKEEANEREEMAGIAGRNTESESAEETLAAHQQKAWQWARYSQG